MKFIRFNLKNKDFYGVDLDDKVLNLYNYDKKYKSFLDILDIDEKEKENINKFIKENKDLLLDKENIKILSPIDKVNNDILCVGINYYEHYLESGQIINEKVENLDNPVFFSKRTNVISGPNDIIKIHRELDGYLDYEVELAVVIGKDGINISKEDAIDHIFGFTIINDLTSRKLQKQYGQWFKGKSLDGYTAIGPCLVSKDEFKYPLEINLGSYVNKENRQFSNTKYMIRDIFTLIEELSKGMTLKKGDIIATGTPSGVGMGFTPNKYLETEDVIKCKIEGIGVLENKIV